MMNKYLKYRFGIIFLYFLITICISCQSGKNNEKQSSESLKIITYNVWYGFTKVPERKSTYLTWLKNQNPDIVSLQELNEYSAQQLAQDAASYGHSYSVLLKEEGFPTGITSRYPIKEIYRRLDGFHHGLIRVKIKDIYYYVVHLHPSNWETRIIEIDQVLQDINSLPKNAKIILAGDFNTFSPQDSVFYSHGRLEPFFNDRDKLYNERNLNKEKLDYSVIQKVLDNGLTDLEFNMRNSDYKFTGTFPTLIEKEGEHGDQRRLDYIFASANVSESVIHAEVVATDTTLILSDHLPVIAKFKF